MRSTKENMPEWPSKGPTLSKADSDQELPSNQGPQHNNHSPENTIS